MVHKATILSEGIESAFDIGRRTLKAYSELFKVATYWKETAKNSESQLEVWTKAATAKGKLIEELRKNMKSTEAVAKRLEKVAADKGAESDTLKDKVVALKVEVGALKENLADLAASSLRKDNEIESLKHAFEEANLKADSKKVVLDDALKELQRFSAGDKSALSRKDEEIASLKLSS